MPFILQVGASVFCLLSLRLPFPPPFNHLLFSDTAVTLLALNLSFMKPQISNFLYPLGALFLLTLLQRWACTCLVKHHQSLMSKPNRTILFSPAGDPKFMSQI